MMEYNGESSANSYCNPKKEELTFHQFLELPPEIRDLIYGWTFVGTYMSSNLGVGFCCNGYSLLRTSTQIRREAKKILRDTTLRIGAELGDEFVKHSIYVPKYLRRSDPWMSLIRKVELTFNFTPSQSREMKEDYFKLLGDWANLGVLEEITLTVSGSRSFVKMMEYRQDEGLSSQLRYNKRPGNGMRFFCTLKEAGGYRSWKNTEFPFHVKRRLNLCLDNWHSVLNTSSAWIENRDRPDDDACEDALDEMHEYFGADLYVGGVLSYTFDGQGRRQCVRKTFPIPETLEEVNLPNGHFVPKEVLPSDWDDMPNGARRLFLQASWCKDCVREGAPVVQPCPHGRTWNTVVLSFTKKLLAPEHHKDPRAYYG